MFELPSSLRVPNTGGHVNESGALPEKIQQPHFAKTYKNTLQPALLKTLTACFSSEISIIKN